MGLSIGKVLNLMNEDIALVFPGQGSQSLTMLNELIAKDQQLVKDICEVASNVLGYDMYELCTTDPLNKLNDTVYTQPALLVAGYIAWQLTPFKENIRYLAGHSLGEYTALVCANALEFTQALSLVAKRGALMQQAVPAGVGAMAAILGLDSQDIAQICLSVAKSLQQVVAPANLNAPGQIVIAGTIDAVNAAMHECTALGAKRALMLNVSVPSHCMLMYPAAEKFLFDLQNINWQAPTIPVVQNYTASSTFDTAKIVEALAKQLYSPVRWIESIEYLIENNITKIIEAGPGKVLTGLNKRIAANLSCVTLGDI
jgi:[acyl-carrier-protein] S-malonyltransferase